MIPHPDCDCSLRARHNEAQAQPAPRIQILTRAVPELDPHRLRF
jgi:hypothetical protein